MTVSIHNTIGHQMLASSSGQWLEIWNPVTAERIAQCPNSDAADLDLAISAAKKTFPSWSTLRPSERARWLYKLAEALEAETAIFAEAETRNTGKPYWLTRDIEVPRAISNLRFFAASASQFSSESHQGEAGLNISTHSPLGVVACISPWNLPLYLLTWKIAPALAAGNCVIAKPSEITPITAAMFAQLAQKIGLPDGVLSILHGKGDGIGQYMVEHPDIKAVSFTGSTAVGKKIAQHCGPALKKVSLELGGKNPSIVFADAPKKHLIATLLRSAFQNSGQICLCGSRVLIEKSMYAEVREALVEGAQHLRIGNPFDEKTQIGPMISQAHFHKVMAHIELAKSEGATLLCGGKASKPEGFENGWFIEPTIFENLGPDTRTNREEIFGPVITLQAFDSDEQAIALANTSEYGLSASVWTNQLQRAHHIARKLECGIVWVNNWMQRDLRTPFGGMKQSGLGREGGLDAMRFFTETKNICIELE